MLNYSLLLLNPSLLKGQSPISAETHHHHQQLNDFKYFNSEIASTGKGVKTETAKPEQDAVWKSTLPDGLKSNFPMQWQSILLYWNNSLDT